MDRKDQRLILLVRITGELSYGMYGLGVICSVSLVLCFGGGPELCGSKIWGSSSL